MATAAARTLFFRKRLKVSFPFQSLLLVKRPRAEQNLFDRKSNAVVSLQKIPAFYTYSTVLQGCISILWYMVFAGVKAGGWLTHQSWSCGGLPCVREILGNAAVQTSPEKL